MLELARFGKMQNGVLFTAVASPRPSPMNECILGTNTVVRSPYSLYSGLPCGSDEIVFDTEKGVATVRSSRCACSSTHEVAITDVPTIEREPATGLRATRDGFLSFLFAGLFHFFPAVLAGPEPVAILQITFTSPWPGFFIPTHCFAIP